jgi:serine/threonine protein kinase
MTAYDVDVLPSRHIPDEDRSGRLVAGRYRILRLLGRGGMGAVWLAVDCVLARTVALKESTRSRVCTGDGADDPQLREARAACAISHPGVVQVHDLVTDGGRWWIVMEALTGHTLAETVQWRGPLSVTHAVDLGLRLLEALQAVHGCGLVHGDVKPGNVHLTASGRPVLTDFGLAIGSGSRAWQDGGYVVGSPAHTAPEVVRSGVRTPASDLFALGSTLYYAVEGVRPFWAGDPVATTFAVLHDSPDPALGGAPLGQVVDGLLDKDPARRLRAEDAYTWLKEIESELTWSSVDPLDPADAASC